MFPKEIIFKIHNYILYHLNFVIQTEFFIVQIKNISTNLLFCFYLYKEIDYTTFFNFKIIIQIFHDIITMIDFYIVSKKH